mmetsp:Transcript_11095/g.18605  ORF Transcript_11095/g.18605 Transcript_11095/m.18605 type:complete len:125 (+) Transcript_11095:545-919(+)
MDISVLHQNEAPAQSLEKGFFGGSGEIMSTYMGAEQPLTFSQAFQNNTAKQGSPPKLRKTHSTFENQFNLLEKQGSYRQQLVKEQQKQRMVSTILAAKCLQKISNLSLNKKKTRKVSKAPSTQD